jgi:hypothetical protein
LTKSEKKDEGFSVFLYTPPAMEFQPERVISKMDIARVQAWATASRRGQNENLPIDWNFIPNRAGGTRRRIQ